MLIIASDTDSMHVWIRPLYIPSQVEQAGPSPTRRHQEMRSTTTHNHPDLPALEIPMRGLCHTMTKKAH